MGFFDKFRSGGNGSGDLMRQATAVTQAYLLERNQKFGFWMSRKIEHLARNVSQQQAHTAQLQEVDPLETGPLSTSESGQNTWSMSEDTEPEEVKPVDWEWSADEAEVESEVLPALDGEEYLEAEETETEVGDEMGIVAVEVDEDTSGTDEEVEPEPEEWQKLMGVEEVEVDKDTFVTDEKMNSRPEAATDEEQPPAPALEEAVEVEPVDWEWSADEAEVESEKLPALDEEEYPEAEETETEVGHKMGVAVKVDEDAPETDEEVKPEPEAMVDEKQPKPVVPEVEWADNWEWSVADTDTDAETDTDTGERETTTASEEKTTGANTSLEAAELEEPEDEVLWDTELAHTGESTKWA